MAEGLVDLPRVAHDGVKVRASAGAGSFRRGARLTQAVAEATAQVEALKREVQEDPEASTRRVAAARQRAATERQQRVARALAQLPAVAARRKKAGLQGPARVSTTDPDARRMTMADGGVRPAFNAQITTATGSQVIVGVAVTNAGTDLGQLRPMVGPTSAPLWLGPGRRAGRWRVRRLARYPGPGAPRRRLPRLRAAEGAARAWARAGLAAAQ